MEREEWKERREQLQALLESSAWKEIAIPAVRKRLAGVERQMAADTTLTLEQLREKQGQWRVLRMLCEEPIRLFGEDKETR